VLIAAAPASAPSGLATVPGLCDELARVRCGGNGSSGEPLRVVCVGSEAAPGWMRWEDLGKEPDDGGADALRARAESIQFDDPMSIMYTSGTTGSPKGATMSHHSLINSGLFVGDRLRYTTLDRVCLPVPLFHTFGCIMGALAALTHGSAIVLPGPIADPKTCVDSIEDERCTSLYGVPSLFAAILASRSFAADRVVSLRTGIMAGAPCPPDLVRDVMTRLHMPEITICYGMTEAGTVCQSLPDDPIERRVGTVGAVHPHMECAIVDPASGRVRPRGEAGELRSRGYASTSGFWNDEQATRNAVTPSGWMRTGDLAVMHEDGYISVVGRIKDMIVSAGQNILPLEVEDVLRSHPQIREGAMVGADEIRRFCRERIASFKVPRRVCFTDALPRTASGKIQKFRLREMSAIDGALERETVSGQT
jgi:fatty-acyl-CoA synthase